jgi:hypothetical protein
MYKSLLSGSAGALLLSSVLSGCGGGDSPVTTEEITPPSGSAVISNTNYVDVSGVAIVAGLRIQFVTDVVDSAFETALQTSGIPGTYPCVFSGTVGYTVMGSTYTFTVNNCDTVVGGRRVLLQSGSLEVSNPTVQTTSVGTSVGYFLTSAAVTFNNARTVEAGATSIFGGSANLSSTVTSPTTAIGITTGANLTVSRAGRTDSYSNINVTANLTLDNGNQITNGSLTVSSPRAPGVLSLSAAQPTLTASATDSSQAILTTSDYVNYTLQSAVGGAVQSASTGNVNSGALAQAINRALQ